MARLSLPVEALSSPKAYPGSPQRVDVAQTRMSLAFMTDEYVYKECSELAESYAANTKAQG